LFTIKDSPWHDAPKDSGASRPSDVESSIPDILTSIPSK
jgi:hypothetical protein